jgi:hypothetical protein
MHLADCHPGFAPAPGTPERAQYYKWMVWLTNTLQAMLIHYFYPDRMAADGAEVKARAEEQVAPMLDQMDAELARHGGPWFLGEHYTAVDPLAFMLCRWTRMQAKPAKTRPALGAYLQRVFDRPAMQRVVASQWTGYALQAFEDVSPPGARLTVGTGASRTTFAGAPSLVPGASGAYAVTATRHVVPNAHFGGIPASLATSLTAWAHFRKPLNPVRAATLAKASAVPGTDDFLDLLSEDAAPSLWAAQLDAGKGVARLASLRFPGYFAFAAVEGSGKWGSVYVGDGRAEEVQWML